MGFNSAFKGLMNELHCCLVLSQTRSHVKENIKVDLREIVCEVSRWLELSQNRDQVWVSGLLALNIAFCCRI
jgi:hypothetical protein